MTRIFNAYSAKFRALLVRVGARNLEKGVQWFLNHAANLQAQRLSPSEAFETIYNKTRRRIAHFAGRPDYLNEQRPIVFVCDVGLGGLARWLRAAGYMAHWRDSVDDPELINEAQQKGAILLTTDSGMMERRVLRDGHVPALWLSPGLTKMQQLESVLVELELPLLVPRCMQCGGALQRVDKEAIAERIPPRTYRWRDEYFLCGQCGRLFWYGTHWNRIGQRLRLVQS